MYEDNVHEILFQHPVRPPLEIPIVFPMRIIAVEHINTSRFQSFMGFFDSLSIFFLPPIMSILPEVSQYFPIKQKK
jgi:hypothetical protein